MKRTKRILLPIIAMIFASFMFNSCVDKEYDEIVTANVDPDLTATHTIKQLQALVTGSTALLIDTDYVIAGIVAGDDLTGNIYKKLTLQDSLSGIAIQLDISNYNTEYPTGRRVFVKLKGLYLQNNDGNYELGSYPATSSDPMGRIPANLVTKYLVKGMWGLYLTPKVYALNDPTIPTNTLVQFNNVEFQSGSNGVPYATATVYNRTIKDCAASPNELIVYSSSFSTFASALTPIGNGSIVGIYTIYSGDGELQIRDTYDVNMSGGRCNDSLFNIPMAYLDSVRLLDPGAGNTLILTDIKKIRVTITSDYTTGMLPSKNAYAQDSTAGIQLRFLTGHSYAIGAVLDINLTTIELSTFAGSLQLNNIPHAAVNPVSLGGLVVPRTVTIPDINLNYNTWESQVVKIDGITISGDSGTYWSSISNGHCTITDASNNTIELYTSPYTSFALSPFPTSIVSITGILSEYNGTKEILIRGTSDVQ